MNKFNNQAIAEAAYYIWKNNGCPANTQIQDWNAAINQLSVMAAAKPVAKKLSSARTLAAKSISLKPAKASAASAKKHTSNSSKAAKSNKKSK